MGEKTAIEWTWRRNPVTGVLWPGFTMNFWIGCTHAGPECDGCYAEALDLKRFSKIPAFGGSMEAPLLHWGPGAPRHRTAEDNWKKPYVWNRAAIKKAGIPLAVFTCSLADFFDQEVADQQRHDAYKVITETQALDWLILSKRTKYARTFLEKHQAYGELPNVWLGATIGHPSSLWRLEELMATPAAVRFLSMEPLLGDVGADPRLEAALATGKIGWVIVGGESETKSHPHKARPMHPDWVRRIQELCHAYGVPFFFKQWGEWAPAYEIQDPQFQAMCALDKVPRHVFDSGEQGRRYSFKVGKSVSGTSLDGVKVTELPKFRYAEAA